MATITVFTPTYNRAYTLDKCYASLKRQTNKDFIWLIIDDGSTDETEELVNGWTAEGTVPIRYIYQENQGMHGAHNTAHENMDTELNVCVDSDDYLADDAIEKILTCWREKGGENVAGIIGLDANPHGEVIGTMLPEYLEAATYLELLAKYKVKGDKKIVYRTALTKKVDPYPIFSGEKYGALDYKNILIDQLCPLLILNEILCHVEYLQDGSSLNMIHQYRNNPLGFIFYRKIQMTYALNYRQRFRAAVHYVSSNIMIKNKRFLTESPHKITTTLAIPFGVTLYFYIKKTKLPTVFTRRNEVRRPSS